MTDVRLTATNPEDSSVVPVACNAKGELKLEEPLAFDGNLNGDLNVTGTSSFAGEINAASGINIQPGSGVERINLTASTGEIFTASSTKDATQMLRIQGGRGSASQEDVAVITSSGTANFAGMVNGLGLKSSSYLLVDSSSSTASSNLIRVNSGLGDDRFTVKMDGSASFSGGKFLVESTGQFTFDPGGTSGKITTSYSGSTDSANLQFRNNAGDTTVKWTADGSATFANGKAGFTADGYLWCTTRRGDTVILDATSNGLATWADYTPSTRREIIEQKVQNIKDAAIKPSQQLPEDPQE